MAYGHRSQPINIDIIPDSEPIHLVDSDILLSDDDMPNGFIKKTNDNEDDILEMEADVAGADTNE